LKYGSVKGGWEVFVKFREELVRRPKNTAKGAAEWELGSECRRGKRLGT
jgi:hypothetical protein